MKTKIKKWIRSLLEKHNIQTRGYRVEWQLKELGGDWDGSHWTFDQLVNDMIKMGEGEFDVWVTLINGNDAAPNECMNYQYFNVNEINKEVA